MSDVVLGQAATRAGDDRVAASRYAAWAQILVLTAVFGAAYSQFPLYYSAQNQYFFHGVMRAGFGLLRQDWVAQTPDPWPLFTALVEFTHLYLDARAFYVYFILLLGVYLFSLVGIASLLFPIKTARGRYLAYLALLVGVHSPVVGALSSKLIGLNLGRALIEGVASQRILWDMFQPGAFGVFLLLSIYLFLRGRLLAAAAAQAVAVAFNPAYLLTAALLTCGYMVALVRREKGLRDAIGLGAATFVLVLPVIAYVVLAFRPARPDLWTQAQDILVHFRLSRHALPAAWFNSTVLVQGAVVLAGLYAVRQTAIFAVLATAAAAAVVLTAAQVVTGNTTLALLYPWRVSVVLVPLATALLIARLVTSRIGVDRTRVLVPLSVLAMVVFAGAGAIVTAQRFTPRAAPEIGAMNFVKTTKSVGNVYMIPLATDGRDPFGYAGVTANWQYFRLWTGAPALVDYWFIPYNDVAVVEWYRRVRAADAFYRGAGARRCQSAEQLRAAYQITHIILKSDDSEICAGWRVVMEDRHYRIYFLGGVR
ncbi:MAG TPA: hypothetical protein VFM39_01230 [bacterium]|nr:hypothetical protein [bacterium]